MFSFSALAAAEPAAVRVVAAGAEPGVFGLLFGFAILLGAVFGTATFDAAGVFAAAVLRAVRPPRVATSGTALSTSSSGIDSCLTAAAFLRSLGGALAGMLLCFDEEGSTSYESSSSPSWLGVGSGGAAFLDRLRFFGAGAGAGASTTVSSSCLAGAACGFRPLFAAGVFFVSCSCSCSSSGGSTCAFFPLLAGAGAGSSGSAVPLRVLPDLVVWGSTSSSGGGCGVLDLCLRVVGGTRVGAGSPTAGAGDFAVRDRVTLALVRGCEAWVRGDISDNS